MNGQYNLRNTGRYCLKCGAQIPDGLGGCANCGSDAGQQETPPAPKRGRAKKTVAVLFVVAVFAALAVFVYWRTLGTPPGFRADPDSPGHSASGGNADRDMAKYTFLVLGADYGEYNTDVIMVVTFDTAGRTLEVVNIPRDTLVNVSWRLKKANSILANMRARNSGKEDAEAKSMEATVEAFSDVLGYKVDYWILVNLKSFVTLVDAVGGVDFDVPVNMNYVDKAGGLSINYSKGVHHLSGQQALEVLRFRAGYSSGDIGRVGTQQAFLKSAAEQILAKKSSLSITDLANVLISNVKTDIKLADSIWFGREFMKLNAEDINFSIMPGNYSASISNQSYVTIYVEEWLELLNDKLSPFGKAFTAEDLSILTRGADKKLYVTDGNRQGDANWGQ